MPEAAKKTSVLVVDDDPGMRFLTSEVLRRAGYEVTSAEDGRVALRLAKTQVFELVITDLIMPEADGLEVIETFKNANNDVRIIAISGGGRIGPESYLNLAKALGARKILAKPFTNAELLSAVQSALHDDEPAPESPVG